MRAKSIGAILFVVSIAIFGTQAAAQDLGPHFKKIAEGIFVRAAKAW
jgi:hypothetical protein